MHKYELDDKTLQKTQLEQHKIRHLFPTSPALAAPIPPPLPTDMNPKVSPLLKRNDSDNDSPETHLDNNDKSLAQSHICKKLLTTHSPS